MNLHEPLLLPSSGAKLALPLDETAQQNVRWGRDAVRNLLTQPRSDGRLLVVIGPCSIHDPDAALDYASRLVEATKQHHRELLIVMRVYVEKPRSTVGWKGLIHDPDYAQTLGHSDPDLNKGVLISRQIMLDIAKKGLPVATELLNPLLVHFFQDIVSVGVVGARTTESQTHREMSSDMPMPMGFKNGMDGGLQVAIDAMTASSRPHTVVGVDDEGRLAYHLSHGNPDTFVILRGGSNGPNFGPEQVQQAAQELVRAGKKPAIVVDCSHGNSMKDYRNQGSVAACLANQIAAGGPIMGVMLESNINEGRQDVPNKGAEAGLKYGVSITDGCVGWHETELILDCLAAAVRERQARSAVVESIPDTIAAEALEDEKHLVGVPASNITFACPVRC
ncbi:phospho-2-dehydro-3-deoxyheptonate aldolase-3 [Coleophoma cylindrospora]|uniref:Phospho-2-dehydro-3-deoxyheptonate aldolase n=1 Tax=Coleophoma cylindrospora TaxID=1849047 RepID=A0A3D8QFN4_9HELO|nr:phospho-2-dehydro-3-deoxyheptonate aldolase-3 [Coleophoma cylindrospora]